MTDTTWNRTPFWSLMIWKLLFRSDLDLKEMKTQVLRRWESIFSNNTKKFYKSHRDDLEVARTLFQNPPLMCAAALQAVTVLSFEPDPTEAVGNAYCMNLKPFVSNRSMKEFLYLQTNWSHPVRSSKPVLSVLALWSEWAEEGHQGFGPRVSQLTLDKLCLIRLLEVVRQRD